MANISWEDDQRDLKERLANNGNRKNGWVFKSDAQLIQEAEARSRAAQNELRDFLRKNTKP